MSHFAQIEFVGITKSLFPDMFVRRKVLEIGSLDINGSVRGLFEQCDYIGLDIGPGPGVDVVCEGQKYDGPSSSFDVVISCEVMEHNPFWQDTLRNMIRLLKPGGLLIMSCATKGRKEHGTARTNPAASPHTVDQGWNYYRNLTTKDIIREVDLSALHSWGFATNLASWDLYMLGVKSGYSCGARCEVQGFLQTAEVLCSSPSFPSTASKSVAYLPLPQAVQFTRNIQPVTNLARVSSI